MKHQQKLEEFFVRESMGGKGALCVGLVVTRHAIENGLPIDPNSLRTPGQGQVSLLGRSAVQKILGEHGITRTLAAEGGRTSRGSLGRMISYVQFLNFSGWTTDELRAVEDWWVGKVELFFNAKPLSFKIDESKSIRAAIRDLIAQAEKRQKEAMGSRIVGTIIQHLVGAKLSVLLGTTMEMHGASVADEVSDRDGDFSLGDVVIHVTTAPGELLIEKCKRNLDDGLKPLIITTYRNVAVAEAIATNNGVGDRIEFFDVEQFIAGNIYELGKFDNGGRRATTDAIISKYNELVGSLETDSSLLISVGK